MGGIFIVLAWVFKYVHCSSLDAICNNHKCVQGNLTHVQFCETVMEKAKEAMHI